MSIKERLGIDFNAEEIEDEDIILEDELQRTEVWRAVRNGCWTASMVSGLMSCNPKGGKMDWFNPYKVFEFAPGAIKIIYSVAMSRKTGRWIDSDIGKPAKYGTKVEPLILQLTKEHFKNFQVEKVGFVKVRGLENAGVSSDLLLLDLLKQEKFNGEIKACTNWNTHYERTFEFMDEKSTDFWQVQMQMIAHETNKSIYIVSEPPRDINKYIYAEDVMELLEDFRKECGLTFQEVKSSEVHQKALRKRLEITEETTNIWLEEGGNLKDIFYEVLGRHKELIKDVVFVSPKLTAKILEENNVFENTLVLGLAIEEPEKENIKEEPKETIKPEPKETIKDIPTNFSF
jgi:hypothetical protein